MVVDEELLLPWRREILLDIIEVLLTWSPETCHEILLPEAASLNSQIATANRAAAKARAAFAKAKKAKNAGAMKRAKAAIKKAEATANLLRPQLVGL